MPVISTISSGSVLSNSLSFASSASDASTPQVLPEEHDDCWVALYGDRNITEFYPAADTIGVDTINDAKYGHLFSKKSATQYARIHANGETLNKVAGRTTMRFRGEDSGAQSALIGSGSQLLKYARNRAGLTFIGLVKPSTTGVAWSVFEIERGFGGGTTFGLKSTTTNQWQITAKKDASTPQTTLSSTAGDLTTEWQLITAAVDFNHTNGSNCSRAYIRKNYAQIATVDPLFTGFSASNSFDSDSTNFNIGTNINETGSYGRFNYACGFWYISYLDQTEALEQETLIATLFGLVPPEA